MTEVPARRVLCVPLRPGQPAPPSDPGARPPVPADRDALATLLVEAYRGTIDDEGESLDEAAAVVQQLFGGDFGHLLWSVSEVVERDGGIVAATLVTLWEERPLLAFTMTLPAWQRQGLSRAGLLRAMHRLAAGDETVLRLVVTRGNRRAEVLYEQLGFVPEPGSS